MKDLRIQEPTHFLPPNQMLPWSQEGPGTPGMERAREGSGSRRQEAAEACASDGRARWELASSLLGLLQDAAQAPQPGLVPAPLLGAGPPEAPALTGPGAGVRGSLEAVGAALVLPQDPFDVPHELPQLGLQLGSVPLVVEATVSPRADRVQLSQRPVVGLPQECPQQTAVQVFAPREHQDGAGQDARPEHLLEAPGHLLVLFGEPAELCHQEHRVRLWRGAGAGLANALSGPPRRRPAGQDVGGVDDLQLPPLPRTAPLLEGLGHRASAEPGLEHSPPEDAVSRGAFPAPGFSHQDEPQHLRGPFIPARPWKHQEKVGGRG